MSTSRERVGLALSHRRPDSVPLDLGGTVLSGMHASSVYALRQAMGLDAPGTPVKVVEPYMMLGEIGIDLVDAIGVDVLPLRAPTTLFGFGLEGWKPWRLFDGTPVLVPAGFNTTPEANGDILMYPGGDKRAAPSGRMPAGGYYFDAMVRQPPIVEEVLDPQDNMEEFTPISQTDLEYYRQEARRLSAATDKAVVGGFCFTSFGDIGIVPAQGLKNPKGIRDIEEWYISTCSRRGYVKEVFERQSQVGIENLRRIHEVVGEQVAVTVVTATDFGAQNGLFQSRECYRDLYMPFHSRVNDWVHSNTLWKTFIHTCGAIADLIPDFIEARFDVLNPLQISAEGMDRDFLKREYGADITFWGGGIDTQKTLPFGTPAQVRAEVRESIRVLGEKGGFVFAPVHNIQAKIPAENLVALFESVADYRG